jgi:hypothetical protein
MTIRSIGGAPTVPLRILDEPRDHAARRDAEEVAVARRLVADPRYGITRVLVHSPHGAYLIEPEPICPPAPDPSTGPRTTLPQPDQTRQAEHRMLGWLRRFIADRRVASP